MKKSNNEQAAVRVSVISIIINVLLTAFKLFAGIISHSAAMISDAVHSASDVLSTFIVIIGVRLANKNSDNDHQYGHERFECVAAIILSVLLTVTGIGIGVSGLKNILSENALSNTLIPGKLALFAAIISIVAKEIMFWITRNTANKINSGALMADAWHHRSDALSSVGSFIGIFGARMGYPVWDFIASIVISIFILKAALDIFRNSISKMTDKSCDVVTVDKIKKIALEQEGVIGIDLLKSRIFGDKIYVDIEISADGTITLNEAHAIAEQVHNSIEENFPLVKHCMVHVNPANPQ